MSTTTIILFLCIAVILMATSSLGLLRSPLLSNYKVPHGHLKNSFSKTTSPRNRNVDTDDSDDGMDDKNYHHDYSKICKGQIYVREHFLTPEQVELLREDMFQLQKKQTETKTFRPSGLSNRVAGDQNKFGSSDRLTCTITPDLWKGKTNYSNMRLVVEETLEDIKVELEKRLSKPNGSLELSEMYYSLSPKGSHLPRHQDERHEMTKGTKGWINETRRSISWLIYLNEHGWGGSDGKETNVAGGGGELRAYVRSCCEGVQCGSHDGNIQVGWLRIDESSSIESEAIYEPVFLDSWVKTRNDDREEDGFEWQALSALYRIRTESKDEQQQQHRDYISQPFGPNSPSWPSNPNLEPVDFASALALQLNVDHQSRFVGVEDIRACQIVDVIPKGGTLVLFDSATVPHEVLETQQGNRMAIAGWYHEPQQDFPEWYGS